MQLTSQSNPQAMSDLEVKLQNAMGEVARLQQIVEDPDVVQMNKIYMDEVVKLANQAPAAFKILMVMIGKMQQFNSLLISNEALGKLTTSSSSTVKRSIKLLRELEWIEVLKLGTSNVYRVNSGRVWQNSESGSWAEFGAHVILNQDEQDEFTRERVPGTFTRHIPLVAANDYGSAKPGERTAQQELGL